MLKTLQLLIIFVLTISFSQAQDAASEENYSRIIMPEASFSVLKPVGIFSDFHPATGIGMEGGIHFQLDIAHPYTIGFLGSYHYFNGQSIEFVEKIGGIDTDLCENVTSQVMTLLGTFRYYPPLLDSEVKVYTDLYFGPKVFFTTYRLTDLEGGDFVNDFSVEKSDVSLSYGIGFGLQIPLWKYIHLNLKSSYLPGVSASYYSKIEPEVEAPKFALDAFEIKNSSTNAILFNIGLSFFL